MTNMNVIEKETFERTSIEIVEFDSLNGSDDPGISEKLYFSQKMGIKLRQVRIILNGGEVVTEAGALHYMFGKIESDNKMSSGGGIAKRFLNAALNNESLFRPTYSGKGEVYLEPSFKHYTIVKLENDELVLDDGMFYCATKGVTVGLRAVKNVSSALFGSDGLTQTVVSGTGLVVLEIPVPLNELKEVKLNGDELKVDGKFAIMRSGGINYSVTKSNKNLLKSWLGGEGLVETFKGVGVIWLAPTANTYQELSRFGGVAPSNLMTGSNKRNNSSGNKNGGQGQIGSGGPGNMFDNFGL